jgi:hypothetical protein
MAASGGGPITATLLLLLAACARRMPFSLRVVHIHLAFPLDGDASIRKFQFNIRGKRSF